MRTSPDVEQPGALEAYLIATGRITPDEPVTVHPLAGGLSNRTVLVRREHGDDWVVKQALSKLRVDTDWYCDPARIHREALGMRRLSELAPEGTITPLIFEDHDNHLLAMHAVPEPHDNFKDLLLAGRLEEKHVVQFARLLGTVHRRSSEQRERLAIEFSDRSFFESLRVEPYYGFAAEQVPAAADFLTRLIEDVRARRHALVHGDYSPKNVLIHGDDLVLLDHEVIHFGDPAFDLGFSLTHLLGKAHHVVDRRADFARASRLYWNTYRKTLGTTDWSRDLEPRAVRHTLGNLLARVAGRSPLEYLDDPDRKTQTEITVALMEKPPARVAELIAEFLERL